MKRASRSTFIRLRPASISAPILRWYSRFGRTLPWRDEKNPYRILVSEVMLQQTQVSRVAEKYPGFIGRFPTISSLARAKTSTVIRAWKGMGYNNRAVRLQLLAKSVTQLHSSKLPRDVEALQSLPGIGKYTAHAIACFAYRRQVPVVDTNVRRVLTRLFPSWTKNADIWEIAERVLPRRRAYDWNQALMDLGSTICTAHSPKCSACPVSDLCPSAFRVVRSRSPRVQSEPHRDGLPNRIYRGRIVENLRYFPFGRRVTLSRLGPKIKEGYGKRDERWLLRLMQSLERDGLVELRRTRSGVAASLPQ